MADGLLEDTTLSDEEGSALFEDHSHKVRNIRELPWESKLLKDRKHKLDKHYYENVASERQKHLLYVNVRG